MTDEEARVLRQLIYEITHLSPMEDDGSHICKISAKALADARDALAGLRASTTPALGEEAVEDEWHPQPSVWLIETPATPNNHARWWNPDTGWMIDPNKGLRLSRRQDAEAIIKATRGLLACEPTEHVWIERRPGGMRVGGLERKATLSTPASPERATDDPPSFPNECCPRREACTCFDWSREPERATAREVTERNKEFAHEAAAAWCEAKNADELFGSAFAEGVLFALAAAPKPPTPSPRQGDVEEIARVLAESYGADPDESAPLSVICTADNQPLPWWEAYTEQARAIIAHLNATTETSDAG